MLSMQLQSFEVPRCNGLGEDAFTKKSIIRHLTLTLGWVKVTGNVGNHSLQHVTYTPANLKMLRPTKLG